MDVRVLRNDLSAGHKGPPVLRPNVITSLTSIDQKPSASATLIARPPAVHYGCPGWPRCPGGAHSSVVESAVGRTAIRSEVTGKAIARGRPPGRPARDLPPRPIRVNNRLLKGMYVPWEALLTG